MRVPPAFDCYIWCTNFSYRVFYSTVNGGIWLLASEVETMTILAPAAKLISATTPSARFAVTDALFFMIFSFAQTSRYSVFCISLRMANLPPWFLINQGKIVALRGMDYCYFLLPQLVRQPYLLFCASITSKQTNSLYMNLQGNSCDICY